VSARTTLVSALYRTINDVRVSNDDHAAIVLALGAGDTARAATLMRKALAARLDEPRSGLGTGRARLRNALAPHGRLDARKNS
jgi:DNA-binding GntR family transcriptional regulator